MLLELSRETNADSVWLLSRAGDSQQEGAHTSGLNGTNLEALAAMVLAAVQSAQALGHFLGQPDRHFEPNMF